MAAATPVARSSVHVHARSRRPMVVLSTVWGLCVVVAFGTMGLGALRVRQPHAIEALFGHGTAAQVEIIQVFELPRILMAVLVGAGLAIAGAVIQGVIRNPLASPDVIGVTKGAALAVVIVLLIYPTAAVSYLPVSALAGGVIVMVAVYLVAYRGGRTTPVRLALVGIAIGALCTSAVQYVMIEKQQSIGTALVWLLGSLAHVDMSRVYQFLPWVTVLIPLASLYAHKLDLLGLGDEVAAGLGVAVERTRRTALFIGVLLASASVAVVGAITFIGLIAPHIARRLVGPRHAVLLPTAAGIGTLVLLIADAIGRGADPPLELPAGMITALIGAPYFIYLLIRSS
jgi:ferric citrate transport system permease protein